MAISSSAGNDPEMVKMAISLRAFSVVTSTIHWRYVPWGKLLVDERDSGVDTVGDLYLENRRLVVGAAMCARGWVFALERLVCRGRRPAGHKDDWIVTALHDDHHYVFDFLPDNHSHGDEDVLAPALVTYVIEHFWRFLHPEVLRAAACVDSDNEASLNARAVCAPELEVDMATLVSELTRNYRRGVDFVPADSVMGIRYLRRLTPAERSAMPFLTNGAGGVPGYCLSHAVVTSWLASWASKVHPTTSR